MPRKLTASLSLSAMAHNLGVVRRHVRQARIWAVVKADGYGHGLLNAMRGFADADGLALLEFEGAARLREHGWTKPILMLEGAFDADDVAQAAAQALMLVVHQPEHLHWLRARQGSGTVDVWLKLNTGLNRLGLKPGDLGEYLRQLQGIPGVRLRGCMTHFANADVPRGADAPLMRHDAMMAIIEKVLADTKTGSAPSPEQRIAGSATTPAPALEQSVANSAACFSMPDAHRDWVRPGIALYGASPFADISAEELGLKPAMRLHGTILAVQELSPGDATGYGSRFVARHPMRIGIVDCGYADGYPRIAPSGTPVAIDGVRSRTLGRVSMDMLAVDLTPVPEARLGTPVELWGAQVPVDDVAAMADTIGYELLCAITPRVRREVIG